MSATERRRSARVPFFEEEPAVIHAVNRDIPVKIVDLSQTGALFSIDPMAPDTRILIADQQLELSIQAEHSVFQVAARVVRTTREFVAVEFTANSEANQKIAEKLGTVTKPT